MNVRKVSTPAPTRQEEGVFALANRKAVEDAIERLIALLDAIDGDPDLEDNADDEPSIGVIARGYNGRIYDDLEEDPAEHDGQGPIAGGGYHV